MRTSKYLYDTGLIEHKLRWGGDWNMNNSITDETFQDLFRFELAEVSHEVVSK